MKLIQGERQSGKTTQLIKECHEQGGYMVCKDKLEAGRVHGQALDMGYPIPFPLTFYEFYRGDYYNQGISKLFIDNVDLLIQGISRTDIRTVTFNSEYLIDPGLP